jgi:two-component system invasion response regulator UvrY
MTMKLLVVDPHPIVVLGCRTLFAADSAVAVTAASCANDAIDAYGRERPDVTLVDFHLPDCSGIALTRRLVARYGEAAVVLLGASDDPLFASQSLEAGARGYVSKRQDPGSIAQAVRDVAAVGVAVSAAMAKRIVDLRSRSEHRPVNLTPREREILRLLAVGRNMAEIADVVNLSYKTVAANCVQLRNKLHARTTVELVHVAGLLGLL